MFESFKFYLRSFLRRFLKNNLDIKISISDSQKVSFGRDKTGEYIDHSGIVVKVEEQLSYDYPIYVCTEYGDLLGFTPNGPPNVGDIATIRVYRCGGGWYPDSRIIDWHMPIATSKS